MDRDKEFLGNEQMTADSKGRVGIPARFMAVLQALVPQHARSIGVMLSQDRSILLMPVPRFNQELARLRKLNDQLDGERLMRNLATSTAEELALDKQNRFKINPLLKQICQIDKDVVIVGNFDYMQLFDLKLWFEMFKHGVPQWGAAATAVALKDEARSAR